MEKIYKTTDIILASCLRLNGYEMAEIEINGTKGTFCLGSTKYAIWLCSN